MWNGLTERQVWTSDQDKDNDDDITPLTKNSLYIRPSSVQSLQLQKSLRTAADEAKLFGAKLEVKFLQDIKYFSDNNLSLSTDHFAPLTSLELQEKCKVQCSFQETPNTIYLKLTIPEEFFAVLGQCITGPRMPRVIYHKCTGWTKKNWDLKKFKIFLTHSILKLKSIVIPLNQMSQSGEKHAQD